MIPIPSAPMKATAEALAVLRRIFSPIGSEDITE